MSGAAELLAEHWARQRQRYRELQRLALFAAYEKHTGQPAESFADIEKLWGHTGLWHVRPDKHLPAETCARFMYGAYEPEPRAISSDTRQKLNTRPAPSKRQTLPRDSRR